MCKLVLWFSLVLFTSCLSELEPHNISAGEQEMQTSDRHFYIDRTGGIILDVSNYQRVGNFSEGLAVVESKEGLTGFIDKSGFGVIKTQFHAAGDFSEGLAAVKTHEGGTLSRPDDKWGYIDKTGRVVIETDYEEVYDFSEGVAVAERGDHLFFIDKTGRAMVSLNTDEVQLKYSGDQKFSEGLIVARDMETDKCGFMDKTGKFVIGPKFNNAYSFSEGLARVSIIENQREFVGFISRHGEYVIQPEFDIDGDFPRNVNDFSEGLASLINAPPTLTEDSKFMYIDKMGGVVLRTEFSRAESFHEGLAVVLDSKSGKRGYIDKSGKLVMPLQYDLAGDFSEGLAHIMISNYSPPRTR